MFEKITQVNNLFSLIFITQVIKSNYESHPISKIILYQAKYENSTRIFKMNNKENILTYQFNFISVY